MLEKTDSEDYRTSLVARYDVQLWKESRMISSGDQQGKSNVFCVYRGITGR